MKYLMTRDRFIPLKGANQGTARSWEEGFLRPPITEGWGAPVYPLYGHAGRLYVSTELLRLNPKNTETS
jgi:hypothetical protein